MSFIFDGSNDSLSGSFASTYAKPVTVACFFKVAAHPAVRDCMVAFGNSSSSENDSFAIGTEVTDDTWNAKATTTAGTTGNATTSAINFDGVWTGIVGKLTSATLRDVYVGAITNTAQGTNNRDVADVLQFIHVGESLAAGVDFTGRLAEIAIWNSALSDADITSYLAGNAASGIDAAHLIGYWPLSSSDLTNLGLDSGGDLTAANQAAFDSDHPTIISGTVIPVFMNQYRQRRA